MPSQNLTLYKIIFSKKAVKTLKDLPRNYQVKIQEISHRLSKDPFKADIKKMQSSDATHRLRIGPYRLFLVVDTTSKEIIISTIKRRTTQTYR